MQPGVLYKERYMGCGSCGGKRIDKPMFPGKPSKIPENPVNKTVNTGILSNLKKAALSQDNMLKWAIDGLTGLIKCVTEDLLYTKEDVLSNRQVCKGCEHSSKNAKGLSDIDSQCMAPDPNNNNAPCGCFILCKTQVGKCPLGKWKTTPITVDNT